MQGASVKLWDPVVRLCHWSLALVFFSNYFLNESGGDWHNALGYYAGFWLVVRFGWGFLAPAPSARWSDFWPTQARLKAHFQALTSGNEYHRLGHSPIGALVMVLMLLLMLGLGITGFLMTEVDYFWGADGPLMAHELFANTLLLLIGVHLSAAVFESHRLGDNLPRSMITGLRKPLPENRSKN